MMKRRRSQEEEEEEEEEEEKKMKMKMIMEMAEEMAKCVVKLSSHSHDHVIQATPISVYRPAPMEFECKTCNRRFSSFQALGGHRASHRKPRHGNEDEDRDQLMEAEKEKEKKKKKHECGICGAVFSMGQALGGHMRRHKALLVETNVKQPWMLDLNLTPLENDINLLFSTYT